MNENIPGGGRSDEQRFCVLMVMLATAFEKETVRKEKVDLYWRFLKGIPVENLERAVQEIIHTRKFMGMPTVAEIEERAMDTTEESLNTRALDAWEQANALIVTGGSIDNPVLDETIRLAFGSWERLGGCNPEQDGFDRAHFVKVYRDVARRAARGELRLIPARNVMKELTENSQRLRELERAGKSNKGEKQTERTGQGCDGDGGMVT